MKIRPKRDIGNFYNFDWIENYYKCNAIKLEDILNYNSTESLKANKQYELICEGSGFYFVKGKDKNGNWETYLIRKCDAEAIRDIEVNDKVIVTSDEFQYLYYEHFFEYNKIESDYLKLHWVYGKNVEVDDHEYYIVRYIGKHSEFLKPIYLIENREEEIYMIGGEGIERVE